MIAIATDPAYDIALVVEHPVNTGVCGVRFRLSIRAGAVLLLDIDIALCHFRSTDSGSHRRRRVT
jgi:hypothetical protein